VDFRQLKNFHGFSGGSIFVEEPFLPSVFREFDGITLECIPYKGVRSGRRLFKGIGARAIIDMLHNWYPDLPAPRRVRNNPNSFPTFSC
jgi:hypothetical protein